MVCHFPAAVLSVQTGGMGFCQVNVCKGKISLRILHLYPVCQMKKKRKRKTTTGNKIGHIRAGSWPLMSLWNACEMDCIFQKPSIYFRVRLKLISTALKGFADIPDKEEQPYVTLLCSHIPLNLFVPHYTDVILFERTLVIRPCRDHRRWAY